MRILVVDDDKSVRDSLRRCLRFNGYEVHVATDGVAALDAVEEVRPDAVILDVMMPRMDGLTACATLRDRGVTAPVLMLTARDSIGDRSAGFAAGADAYLPKPFALGDLLSGLDALLTTRPRADVPSEVVA